MRLLCETNLDEPHHNFGQITYCSCAFSRCKKNHCIFSHEKKFAIKPQYFRIRQQKKGACIKYAHANKKHYSSIVDAAVQHDILHNRIKENIVIISYWKGTFIKCKTCKHILTGKKGWFGKK